MILGVTPLRRPDSFIQALEFQLIDVRLPVARLGKRDPPAPIFHFLKQICGFALRIFDIRGADSEGSQVEHNVRELGVDVVLDVVLPGVCGRGSIEC